MLIVSVTVMAIVAALLGTWVVVRGGRSVSSSALRHGASTVTAPPTAQAGHSSGGSGATGAGTTVPTTAVPVATTTTTLAPVTGTNPVLSTIEPASGSPGQTLVMTGSNLLSPSGQITANFGAETATVACLAQTSCLVIVPPDGAFVATTPVTVTTDSGTSNALMFTYT
jgi:hypothetical protein